MIKNILKKMYYCGQNLFEKAVETYMHYNERKKFKDPRRVAIYSEVQLSAEQKKQIDAFYLQNYGHKIPYIWHQLYAAYTGNFDVQYFPDILFSPEFEKYMHDEWAYQKAFSDKNLLPYIAKTVGVKMPKTLLSCANGLLRDGNNNHLSCVQFEQVFGNIGEAFIKPSVDSSSGIGCRVVNMQHGKDASSGQTTTTIMMDLGKNFIVQERIKCHESIAKIYPHSVNTFRVITYRWKEHILAMPVIMRIGRGGKNVDNAHAGGMFIAVEPNGALHKTAFTEFNEQFTEHPDTHLVFEGYKIFPIDTLIATAQKMHAVLPQIGCYNWDFTLDREGNAILMEANTAQGSIWLIQMAHGEGCFGEHTAEVLRWTAKMKELSYSERKFYNYGYMEKQGGRKCQK